MLIYAGLAQLVEQRIRNAWVECSSHLTGTRFIKGFERFDNLGFESYPKLVPRFFKTLCFLPLSKIYLLYVSMFFC